MSTFLPRITTNLSGIPGKEIEGVLGEKGKVGGGTRVRVTKGRVCAHFTQTGIPFLGDLTAISDKNALFK